MIDIRRQNVNQANEDNKWRIRDLKNHKDLFLGTKEECEDRLSQYKNSSDHDRFEKFFGIIDFKG